MALKKRYLLLCTEMDQGLPGAVPKSRHTERERFLCDLSVGQEMEVASYFRSYGPRGTRVAV